MHTIFNGFLALVIMQWPLKASPFCCSTNPQNKRWHWRRGDARHLSIKDVPVKGIRCALDRSKTWMTRTRTRATATPLVSVISSQHFLVSEKGLNKNSLGAHLFCGKARPSCRAYYAFSHSAAAKSQPGSHSGTTRGTSFVVRAWTMSNALGSSRQC